MNHIQHALYINLKERADRNAHFVEEMKKIGLSSNKYERINALHHLNPAIGCSLSHLKCLYHAKLKKWEHVLIMEDDIHFLDVELFSAQLNAFFKLNKSWDVLIVAGNNMLPFKAVNDICIQVMNCITTTGYIVQRSYYDTLIDNYREGIMKFILNPEEKKQYAIDKYWLHLQIKDRWYMLIPPTIVQYENYSDIEKRETNFTNYFLNYNKMVGKIL